MGRNICLLLTTISFLLVSGCAAASLPTDRLPTYGEVLATYAQGTTLCKTEAAVVGTRGENWTLQGSTEFRNNQMLIQCHGARITVQTPIQIEGKSYPVGTKLTVTSDLKWIEVASWDTAKPAGNIAISGNAVGMLLGIAVIVLGVWSIYRMGVRRGTRKTIADAPFGHRADAASPEGAQSSSASANVTSPLARLPLKRPHYIAIALLLLGLTGFAIAQITRSTSPSVSSPKPPSETLGSMAWSPDGSVLAAGAVSGNVLLWDAKTYEARPKLPGHSKLVRGLAWSPDSSMLASASEDGKLIIWDTKAGTPVHTLTTHTAAINVVRWSPDGTMLASGSDDTSVIVWNAKTGEAAQTLKGHADDIVALAWDPNSKYMATAGADQTVRIWDLGTGTELGKFDKTSVVPPRLNPRSLDWSPDGTRLAIGDNSVVRIWTVEVKEKASAVESGILYIQNQARDGGLTNVRGVDWAANGQRLATTSSEGTIRIWDAATGNVFKKMSAGIFEHFGLAFSPDESQLATVTTDTVLIWDANTGAVIKVIVP